MKDKYPEILGETFTPFWHMTLSNDDYHADKSAVSSTVLKTILKSPRAFYAAHILGRRDEETDAMRFGSAVHMALLEPDLFEKSYVIVPKFEGEGSVKARKQWKEALSKDAVVLKEDEYVDLMEMIESVSRHPEACNLLKNGQAEQTGYFRDPDTGIKCRIRPDFIHLGVMAMLDVKTTRNCEMSDFSKTIWSLKYHMQLAMYCLGVELITGKKVDFPLYLAIEKKPPYEVAVYLADDLLLQKGYTDYRNAMAKLKTCLETDMWDTYQNKHQVISLPKWALTEGFEYD